MKKDKKTIKVYVVGPSTGYSRFIKNRELVNNMEYAQVVLFTGGEDINPRLYNKPAHHSVYYSDRRDKMEVAAFEKIKPGQIAVGVCRGVQLFCALYGGILVQDCDRHCGCGRHTITDGTREFTVTSIHHQMQYPYDLPNGDYEVLFWSEGRSTYYKGDGIDAKKIREFGEPEVTVYHRPGMPLCFGVQGHPEMMSEDDPFVEWVNEKILEYVKG